MGDICKMTQTEEYQLGIYDQEREKQTRLENDLGSHYNYYYGKNVETTEELVDRHLTQWNEVFLKLKDL